jgi:hypothetical protein
VQSFTSTFDKAATLFEHIFHRVLDRRRLRLVVESTEGIVIAASSWCAEWRLFGCRPGKLGNDEHDEHGCVYMWRCGCIIVCLFCIESWSTIVRQLAASVCALTHLVAPLAPTEQNHTILANVYEAYGLCAMPCQMCPATVE